MKTFIQTLFLFLLTTQICFTQWYQQNSNTTKNLDAVTFIDDYNGFAVGDSGTILHTTNAGAIWEQQTSGTILQLQDVLFINESNGWIVGLGSWPGYGNVLLHTTDAGINWIQQITDTSLSLNSIFFLNENVGWIAGGLYADTGSYRYPIILKTTDGGSNWHESVINISHALILNDVFFIDANIGFAAGGIGDIMGSSGSIFKTTNGGENWIEQISNSADYKSIQFFDEQNGIAVGRSGFVPSSQIVRTTDGGINWVNTFSQWYPSEFNSVAIANSNFAWAVGWSLSLGSTIFFSSDKGVNWASQIDSALYLNSLNSVSFINSTTGWVVGSGGIILHTTNGGVTFIEEEQIDDLPTTYSLSNNFPNPFNPSTKIIYSVPQTSQVQIKVFDVLGNEIETLVNEEKPVGTYELTWNAEGLPSGVYFYRMQAGTFIETKKMMVLK